MSIHSSRVLGTLRLASRRKNSQTTWCAEKAISFIEANAPFEAPWLLSVNPFDPHHPFDPPTEYLERYLDRLEDIPSPNYLPGELDEKPLFQKACHKGAYNVMGAFAFDEMSGDDHRLIRAAYWAMIDLIDAAGGPDARRLGEDRPIGRHNRDFHL